MEAWAECTARVLAENPVLLRLKELDAYKEIAQHIGEVRLVVGTEHLGALLPAEMFARDNLLTSKREKSD